MVSALGALEEDCAAPTEAFRNVQMALALGVCVSLADGAVVPEEREALDHLIEMAPDLEDAERRRLRAELPAYATAPVTLADFRIRLNRTSPEARRKLAANVIHIARADGHIDPKEAAFIEALFRQLELSTMDFLAHLLANLLGRRIANAHADPMGTTAEAAQERNLPETPRSSISTEWISAGQTVVVAGRTIDRSMIYVGSSLPRRGGGGDENCLINPDLEVAAAPDRSGNSLSYWPAYAELTPRSRAAYLDWLAGRRSDPTADIGFVFLYFYGLERRLMLEEPGEEAAEIVAEIRRLLDIYGGNHSFRRYATTLLEAEAARRRDPSVPPTVDFFSDGGEPRLALRIALGVRAQEGRAIESDLLLAFVMTHPETRVRTPARRALPELRLLFDAAVEKAFPGGARFSRAGRARRLAALYSSASGTFTSEILPKDLELPDVMRLSEPLTIARRLFESCSAQLEAYSRELGRANGLEPNLSTLAHLPLELRNIVGGRLSGAPLSALAEFATKGAPIDPGDFARAVGLGKAGPKDIGELREWARILEAFGFGVTSDPLFALRRPTPQTPFVVFSLAAGDNRPAPTESFRTMQMTVAVAIMVALADGVFSPEEEEALARLIDGAPGLEEMERRRLRARTGGESHQAAQDAALLR